MCDSSKGKPEKILRGKICKSGFIGLVFVFVCSVDWFCFALFAVTKCLEERVERKKRVSELFGRESAMVSWFGCFWPDTRQNDQAVEVYSQGSSLHNGDQEAKSTPPLPFLLHPASEKTNRVQSFLTQTSWKSKHTRS
jgi:hypothetical protein